MEFEHHPSTEFQAVMDLQLRHWQLLENTDIIMKINAYAQLRDEQDIVVNKWPIILGSEANGVKQLFIAFREPREQDSMPAVSSHYFRVGSCIDSALLPSRSIGLTDEELAFVDGLFQEAQTLKETAAPNYSLESGLIR